MTCPTSRTALITGLLLTYSTIPVCTYVRNPGSPFQNAFTMRAIVHVRRLWFLQTLNTRGSITAPNKVSIRVLRNFNSAHS